jgi:abelson tyrosine-protein kinase 1
MRAVLQTNNDVQIIEVLQVGREEMPEAIKTLQRALERERDKENVIGGAGFSLVLSKGAMITATPGATPFTGLTNNKPGVVQQLPTVPEGRRGSMPVTGMHETAALERRKTLARSESKESGTVPSLTSSGNGSTSDGRPRDVLRRVSYGPDTFCLVVRSRSEYSRSFFLRLL